MRKEEMAKIFSLIVHDYSENVLVDAIAEERIGTIEYRRIIESIYIWAQKNKFYVLEQHAGKLLRSLGVNTGEP